MRMHKRRRQIISGNRVCSFYIHLCWVYFGSICAIKTDENGVRSNPISGAIKPKPMRPPISNSKSNQFVLTQDKLDDHQQKIMQRKQQQTQTAPPQAKVPPTKQKQKHSEK